MVHAVFRNSKGHVCETTPQDIDSRLDILLGKKTEERGKEGRGKEEEEEKERFQAQEEIAELEGRLKEEWIQTCSEAREIFTLIKENSFYSADYGTQLSKVLKHLQATRQQFGVFHVALRKAQAEEHADGDMEEDKDVVEETRVPPERPSTPPLEMMEEDQKEKEDKKGKEDKKEKESEKAKESEKEKEVEEAESGEPSLADLSQEESGKFESTMEKVSGEVQTLKGKTLALEGMVGEISPEILGSNVKEGRRIINQIQRAWGLLSEALNRNLVSLDELVVGPAERPRRKELVLTIQDLTNHLESFSQKIQKVAEAHKGREKEEDERQEKLQEEKQQQNRQAATSMEVEETQAPQQSEGSKLRTFEENLSKKIKVLLSSSFFF